jgi:wyosine [tRNA(Phe)-imidazoG37] synthetase (radical SAM superfamily)
MKERIRYHIARNLKYELSTAIAFGRGRAARPAMRRAFAALSVRIGWRGHAISQLAIDAARLKRIGRTLAAGDAANRRAFCDQFLAACERAHVHFVPAELQSYVDVSVRATAARAFAEYVASEPVFGGDAASVTALLLEQEPDSRPALLAHAAMLLDASKPAEATPWIRRALRVQSVCPTAQQLLARAVAGTDYDLTDKFCPMPFTHLSTSFRGDSFACCCPAWVPYSIGNVLDAPSADVVWNSEAAVEVRRSIHDGDFRYCSRTLCSYIAAKKLPLKSDIDHPVLRRYIDERTVVLPESPTMVQMNHDQSCNLACPSCRTSIITAGPEEQRTYLDAADRVLLPLLRKMDGMTYISGGGEAFASAHYKKILASLNRRDYPGLYVFLITNGQLLNAKRWNEFPELPEMIGNLSVSIDAARGETYERLRRPGKWPVLMSNLELMSEMRAAGKIPRLQINFVVQADNFRELPEFVAMGHRLGVDSIWLQRLTNYGSFPEAVFAKADVTAPAHPDHAELLAILRQPFMHDPRVDMHMLMPLLPEIVSSDHDVWQLRIPMRWEMPATEPRLVAEV